MTESSWKDVPLGKGRTLRVSLEDGKGQGTDRIRLSLGTGTGGEWEEDPEGRLSLPAKAVSPLVLALLEIGDQAGVR